MPCRSDIDAVTLRAFSGLHKVRIFSLHNHLYIILTSSFINPDIFLGTLFSYVVKTVVVNSYERNIPLVTEACIWLTSCWNYVTKQCLHLQLHFVCFVPHCVISVRCKKNCLHCGESCCKQRLEQHKQLRRESSCKRQGYFIHHTETFN